ncbi:MAG: hypothetical protein Q4B71_02465 [Cardiobacteriaceae bacterium]|nr:hypothetical protein [Cardiobacteriaceae bacterium]
MPTYQDKNGNQVTVHADNGWGNHGDHLYPNLSKALWDKEVQLGVGHKEAPNIEPTWLEKIKNADLKIVDFSGIIPRKSEVDRLAKEVVKKGDKPILRDKIALCQLLLQ